MKKIVVFMVAVLGILASQLMLAETALAAAPAAKSEPVLKTQNDKLSYTLGYDLGKDFKHRDVMLNSDLVHRGIMDAQQGKARALSEADMQATLDNFQKQMLAKNAEKLKQLSEKNKQAGDAFLAKNKTKQGVVTLKDGVQYKIIKAGKGKKPTAKDSVTVKYEGRSIEGNVFDQSTKPVTFNVTDVIPGWTEILQLMPVGSTWEVYIPASQAYGERGVPRSPIGPNQTLVFKISLLSVNKPGK